MKGSLSDILVVSDMDGTLLNSNCELLQCNLETIRLFTALGGKFAVATGRDCASVKMYPELVELLSPSIILNGCAIYDFQNDAAVKSSLLPHLPARQALRDIIHSFPNLGAMVMGADFNLYQVAASEYLAQLIEDEDMCFLHKPYEDLPSDWNKVLFSDEEPALQQVVEFVESKTYPGTYFVKSAECYYEMLPKGVSKGSALLELCDVVGVSIENTYAIGDYYNDADMLRLAGHSAAVANAPDDIKAMATEVISSNDEGAVGQFLYKIIQKYADAK